MGLFDSVSGLFGGGGADYDEILAEANITPSPLTATTGAGTATFTPGIDGSPGSISTQLSPELQKGQGAFFGVGTETLDYLRNQFNPEEFAQNYFRDIQRLRQPGYDLARGRVGDRLNATGRTGFQTGKGAFGGGQVNPEFKAFYDAQAQQMSQDAFAADNAAFSRFNDLLKRAGGSYGQGIALDEAVMNPLSMANNMQQSVYGIEERNKNNIMNARFAEADEGSMFDDLLGLGMNVGLGYLTGGASFGMGGGGGFGGFGNLFGIGNSIIGSGWNNNQGYASPF